MSLIYILFIAAISYARPHVAPPLPADVGPQTRGELLTMVLRSFLPPALLIFMVLGSIFFGWATPTEASGVGSLGAILLAAANRRLSLKVLREVLHSAALTNGMVFFIFFGATVFSYVFRALGGDDLVKELLVALGIDTGWEILVFLMVLVFFLGFFFDWIEICLIVLPVFAPILKTVDFGTHLTSPRDFMPWFAVLIAVNLQTAFLTPPFGFTLFYMKGTVPRSVTMAHIYRGIVPFVVLQLLALALAMIFPKLTLWLPRATGFLD
jgi:tripartite ATP-independent transporter DctM subunit